MKQYKILGQMKMEKLEEELNRLADDGWRVSVCLPPAVRVKTGKASLGPKMERPTSVCCGHTNRTLNVHMIIRNQFFQRDWKKGSLSTAFTLHKAHKKMPSLSRGHLLIYFGRSTEFRNSLKRAPFYNVLTRHVDRFRVRGRFSSDCSSDRLSSTCPPSELKTNLAALDHGQGGLLVLAAC